MSEWRLPPDYIVKNWTEELLNLMVDKLVERKDREALPSEEDGPGGPKVSDSVLFSQANSFIKVVKQ